ncbi:hypothetical protein [Lutimaribacter saemankumensis]|uniref:Uncharacterized protein n=1 Tax=Lutimaribacter saemankumensis TaxID=490829 RepID=A0A1G8SQ18_9RHOB|nr:hypothetical protein [Lutimaribacter saemankumensis]SDJ31368.1 hypothetical protein SAMN05421850_11313 [Lutimaribacter saemankumensis]
MTEQERQERVYQTALRRIREKERIESGFAGGLVAVALTMEEVDRLSAWGERAKTFVYLFAMALPPYFVWAFLLN